MKPARGVLRRVREGRGRARVFVIFIDDLAENVEGAPKGELSWPSIMWTRRPWSPTWVRAGVEVAGS